AQNPLGQAEKDEATQKNDDPHRDQIRGKRRRRAPDTAENEGKKGRIFRLGGRIGEARVPVPEPYRDRLRGGDVDSLVVEGDLAIEPGNREHRDCREQCEPSCGAPPPGPRAATSNRPRHPAGPFSATTRAVASGARGDTSVRRLPPGCSAVIR